MGKSDLYRMGNAFIDQLEEDGVVIIRPRECYKRNITDTLVVSDIRDDRTVLTPLFASGFLANDSTLEGTNDVPSLTNPVACRSVEVTNPVTTNTHSIAIRSYDADAFRCHIDWQLAVA